MRYLSLEEIIALRAKVTAQSGGSWVLEIVVL